MNINLEVIKNTIESRRDELKKSRHLTNELVVDDLMLALGYDKKRDESVKRIYGEVVDWEVKDKNKDNNDESDNKIVVKTFAVGEEKVYDEVTKCLDFAKENKYTIVIITNGDNVEIYAYNIDYEKYMIITDINICNDTSEINNTDKIILDAISKYEFDASVIEEIVIDKYVSTDRIVELLIKNGNNIVNTIASIDGIVNTERIKKVYEEIISGSNIESAKKNRELKVEISDLNTKLNNIQIELNTKKEELNNKQIELDNLNSKYEAIQEELNNKQIELDNLNSKYEAIQEELNNKQIELDNKNIQENSSNNIQDSESNVFETSEDDKNKIDELTDKLEKANEIIEELNNKITTYKETSGQGEDDYIEKINELTDKLETSIETNSALENKIKELNKEIENLSGTEKKQALELLDVIQADDNSPRQYVGVINTELFQYSALGKFVGASLHKLYELKNFEASQFIFNGDIFLLDSDSKRNELMMNNKNYDIVIDGMSEDEVLNKLRVVFSHFSDVIFECKKIGTLQKEEENIQEETKFILGGADITDFVEDDTESIETIEELADDVLENTNTVETLFSSSELQSKEDEDIAFNTDFIQSNEVEKYKVSLAKEPFEDTEPESFITYDNSVNSEFLGDEHLLVTQLLSYSDLIYTDEDIKFNKIKYIGNNSITFDISNCSTLDKAMCKCIDALLAIEESRGRSGIIKELKNFNLFEISEIIERYMPSTKDCPKITATKFCVTDTKTVVQIVKALYDICIEFNIDMSELFVYVTANTTSSFIIDGYSYDETNIVIYDNTESDICNSEDKIAILKGDIFTNIILTQNSLNIHSKLFQVASGIKTKYLKKSLKSYDDIVETIRLMIEDSMNSNVQKNSICNCNTLDGRHKIVSTDTVLVTADHDVVNVNGETFYISKLDNWEVAETLIRMHTEIYNDTAIAVKVSMNEKMYNFLVNDFITSEPSLELAIRSLINYLAGVVR